MRTVVAHGASGVRPVGRRADLSDGGLVDESALEAATVLVVDDDADIRECIALILRAVGYSAATCADGREALDYLASHTARAPELIVLDLSMPVLDGWQFCREQRDDPRLAAIPVIVLSAVLDTAPAPPPTRTNAYLEKPVEPHELLDLVRLYCGKHRH